MHDICKIHVLASVFVRLSVCPLKHVAVGIINVDRKAISIFYIRHFVLSVMLKIVGIFVF